MDHGFAVEQVRMPSMFGIGRCKDILSVVGMLGAQLRVDLPHGFDQRSRGLGSRDLHAKKRHGHQHAGVGSCQGQRSNS